jgi:IS6 family transposase
MAGGGRPLATGARSTAIDQFGQVIDVFVSARRDAPAARRLFDQAIGTTDQAPIYPAVLEDLPPAAWHRTGQ